MENEKVVFARHYPAVVKLLLEIIKDEIKPTKSNTDILQILDETIKEMDYIFKKCYIIKKD